MIQPIELAPSHIYNPMLVEWARLLPDTDPSAIIPRYKLVEFGQTQGGQALAKTTFSALTSAASGQEYGSRLAPYVGHTWKNDMVLRADAVPVLLDQLSNNLYVPQFGPASLAFLGKVAQNIILG